MEMKCFMIGLFYDLSIPLKDYKKVCGSYTCGSCIICSIFNNKHSH